MYDQIVSLNNSIINHVMNWLTYIEHTVNSRVLTAFMVYGAFVNIGNLLAHGLYLESLKEFIYKL